MKKIFSVLLIIAMLSTSVLAKGDAVVSIGKDLNSEQRSQMMELLGADENSKVIEVTNEEERKYLGNYVDSKILGSRAISSSYVEKLSAGEGIQAEVYNVTWVTKDMIINALVTAGVKDAKVKVAAPFSVSGTAALTGILKGFEDATGTNISELEKQVANEEIAKTGELGQEIGKDEATQLIKTVKEEVVEKKIKDPEEIKKVVTESAKEINITLTDEQLKKITDLMENISKLDLDLGQIKAQLKNISDKLSELGKNSEEVKSVLGKILEFVKGIFQKLFGATE
ncbi:hypothetical protein DUF1002 [Gottschalkia acidurici 9a]|uniref:DUF1002 domain-containing protein n=1 Tax=Gottschalkia acidurici (strain ATCC 7906 / DSM 604 / BCRC 14475 / CIP 104303 / KCTC 5404 / NCIMB 10678 / 9a) TaxID=1128398 RepID=K0B2F8_GOTA9|nr:DUF1002 domain-containing protein [Gottschalkia acidurici]AFS79292.1 hypothetical protein DUF1002 [Gottschalkia acidurici 9a]